MSQNGGFGSDLQSVVMWKGLDENTGMLTWENGTMLEMCQQFKPTDAKCVCVCVCVCVSTRPAAGYADRKTDSQLNL